MHYHLALEPKLNVTTEELVAAWNGSPYASCCGYPPCPP